MSLTNKKIIVTGGPTREWIDPVRFISNPSTGKMGVALANVATSYSQDVVFIHGEISLDLKEYKFSSVAVESTEDMLNSVLKEIQDNSILIMAAAPADYTVVEKSPIKIKKGEENLQLNLKRTPDILKTISKKIKDNKLKDVFLIGFAAESNDVEHYAKEKLVKKNLDMICLNDVSKKGAGFASDTNIITIFTKNGKQIVLPIYHKNEVAEKIFFFFFEILSTS